MTDSDAPLYLVGTDGGHYYNFPLQPGLRSIGRTPDADCYVPDRTVSRLHAEIQVPENGQACVLTDKGSHNGTTVNGRRISEPTEIGPGDELMFGQTEFRLSMPEGSQKVIHHPTTATRLAQQDPEHSVFLPMNEALEPLPAKVTERSDLFPVLYDMAKLMSGSEPKETMLEKSLALVHKIIPAERLAVLFTSEDESEIYTAATLLPGDKDPGEFALSRTIIKEILSNRQAILIGDASDDPRFAQQQSVIMLDLKSAMAVPLFDEGTVLGVLYVDSTNPVHRYDNDYLRLLATFGNLLGSRLLNYNLMQEREANKVMEAELSRASSIQQNLLPKSPPTVSGFSMQAYQKQTRLVGGDLYDMALLPDGRLVFVVADVSGKGMGAALLMAHILASLRVLYNSAEFSLVNVIDRISKQLFRYSAPEDFATLVAGVATPDRGELHYVNAGHNSPVVIRRDGSIEHLDASGTMIGAFDFSAWTEAKVDMAAGDVLFIYSDGVVEAESGGADPGQYGEERMERVLIDQRDKSPTEIADSMMQDIERFVGSAPQSDDITFVIIKRD